MTAADYIKPDSKATATKQQAIESLQKRVVMQQQQLRNIDPRLEEYYLDLCQHSTTEPDDPTTATTCGSCSEHCDFCACCAPTPSATNSLKT